MEEPGAPPQRTWATPTADEVAHMKPYRLWMLRLKFLQPRHQVFDLSSALKS